MAEMHTPRAAITEEILARTFAGRQTPYSWLARAVSARALLVLDVACGAGRMSRELAAPGRTVIGLDNSRAALTVAASQSAGPWVQADATQLPFADESLDAVTTAMGLMVIESAPAFLDEVARVLKPGGVFAAISPTVQPVRRADLVVLGRLTRLLRANPRMPASLEVITGRLLKGAGLTRAEDRRQRYAFAAQSTSDAERLLDAFYPASVDPELRAAAVQYLLGSETGQPVTMPIPIRRLVAVK